MYRFDLEGLSLTLANLVLNIGLVVGLYFVFTFFKKLIDQGKFQMKIWEVILGVLLIVIFLFLKFSVI